MHAEQGNVVGDVRRLDPPGGHSPADGWEARARAWRKNGSDSRGLSPREIEIVVLLAAEHKDRVIAERLGISYNTLRTELTRLEKKVGAVTRLGIVVKVAEGGAR